MSKIEDVKTILWNTIHEHPRLSPKQIADLMGIDYTTLCRYALTGESGTDIPLGRAINLMTITGNYSLLKHTNMLCDHLGIKVPFFRASRGDSNEIVSTCQEASTKAIADMIQYFKDPTNKKSYKTVINSLHTLMEKSVSAKKYIDKELSGQLDAFEQD